MTNAVFQADAILEATPLAFVETHAGIDSTNNRALRLCRDAALPTPALVVAERQSAGRGRRDRPWWSPDGALLMSLIIEPPRVVADPQRRHGLVALAAAAGVADAVEHLLGEAPVAVKWPNDVLLNGRKLAGILIEAPHLTDAAASRLVVGIGLNVNNQSPDYASLAAAAGREFDLQQALVALLQSLLPRFDQVWRGDQSLLDAFAQRCALTGRDVEVTGAQGIVSGTCRGVAEDGALMIETSEGMQTIHSGAATLM